MTESIAALERWEGGFPGPLEFADLDGLKPSADNPGIEEVRAATEMLVERWQGNQFAGLYLYGTPGTGKSHAAIGVGRALHETGAEVHYRFGPELSSNTSNTVRSWTGERTDGTLRVFPSSFVPPLERNPKSVLIFDEYQPPNLESLRAATEAAAQYGGLIIVTSNSENPFDLVEPPKEVPAAQDILAGVMLTREDPEKAAQLEQCRAEKLSRLSASLASRVSAGFRFIEFGGIDWRQQQSFWGH